MRTSSALRLHCVYVASVQTIDGPLHEGIYAGHCLSGDDLHEAVMTVGEAKQWLQQHPEALAAGWKWPLGSTTACLPPRPPGAGTVGSGGRSAL